jgi:hypothetical protein
VEMIDYFLRHYREEILKRHGGLIARDAFRTMVDVETLASQKPHERYVELLCNLNGKARRRTYAHYHGNSRHQGLLKQFEARPAR